MVEQRNILTFVRQLAEKFEPERVVLFGSYAGGTPTDDSDVDLLVVMHHNKRNVEQSLDIMRQLRDKTGETVIISVIDQDEGLILDQIQQFADSRNALVHERAYWNQDSITTAQREAIRAIKFMNTVDSFINAMPSGQRK